MSKFQVWYMKPEYFHEGIFGNIRPRDEEEMKKTHVHLTDLDLPGGPNQLERVFFEMQAEVWSPNGEARGLIKSKGLGHTSMSVGDIIVDEDGRMHSVINLGFKELN